MKAKRIITFATSSLLLCATPALHAQTSSSSQNQPSSTAQRGQFSESDYSFAQKAAQGNTEEVQMGKLAEQKSSNPAVKEFGQRMVTDHSKLNAQLKQLAGQKGAMVPTSMSHHEESKMQHLENESGAAFDKAYVKDMVKEHKHDLKEFQSAAKSAQDPELRAYAQSAVPILQEHLTMAENLEKTVKSEK